MHWVAPDRPSVCPAIGVCVCVSDKGVPLLGDPLLRNLPCLPCSEATINQSFSVIILKVQWSRVLFLLTTHSVD